MVSRATVVILVGILLYYVYKNKLTFVYPVKTPAEIKPSYDYIVVGSGSAGSVVAGRLSEDRKTSVLLIEAGSDGREILYSHIPGFAPLNQLTSIDWQYLTEPQKQACLSLKNQQSRWPRGKVLGGSSVLNYMAYVRGSPKDYDHWAEEGGVEGWSYKDVLPYFKKMENAKLESPDKDYRGNSGPIWPRMAPATKLGDAILAAAAERGYPMVDDYNGPRAVGFSRYQHNVGSGWRMSSSAAYIYPHRFRTNLHILTRSTVIKVLINKQKEATGVEFIYNGERHTVNAEKEVVVSGGAIGSPQLLLLSGIGPQQDLQALQIPVVQNSPAVGKNLQDHVMVGFLMSVNESIGYDVAPLVSLTTAKRLITWATQGEGPLSWSTLEINGFLHSNVDATLPTLHDLQIWMFPTDGYMDGNLAEIFHMTPEIMKAAYANKNGRSVLTIGTGLQQPRSVGEIKLRTSNPLDHPIIDPKYLTHPRDVKAMVKGCKVIFDLLKSKAAQSLDMKPAEGHLPACAKHELWSEAYFECIIRHKTLTIYHPTSTCRMGADPKTSVVDSQLRVHGIKKLRVADTSVFPRITSGNTNVPAIMVAEKAADLIKQANR